MFAAQEKSIVIVCNSETKQAAELFSGLIGELPDDNVRINAVVIDENIFAKYPPENKSATQKIIYIGDFPESRLLRKNIIKWQFNEFGIRYGWLGNRALIFFDNTKMSENEFYKMAESAKAKFNRHGINMSDKVDEVTDLSGVVGTVALAAAAGIGYALFKGFLGIKDSD